MKTLKVLTASLLSLSLCACGASEQTDNANTIKVVATANPHALILEQAKPLLKEKGYDLEIIETDDYYMPNEAVASKDADANFFQHVPFFENEIKQNNYDLVSLGGVHIEPFGFYSKTVKSLDELQKGDTIIISNSIADNGRILSMLEDAKLIKLKDGVTPTTATMNDIEENPKELVFHEVKPELLVTAYENEEGQLVAINGNYAIQGDLNPKQDAILLEDATNNNPYVNIVVCRKEDETSDKMKALMDVLTSNTIKEYINDTWANGAVLPVNE